MNFNLLELKIFKDVASERNFVKAAKLNSLTQPSISSHLKQLEKKLGIKLFERAPRKVHLTEEGKFLLPYAEEIILKTENLKSLASQSTCLPKGDIRIATIFSIGIYEMALVLKKFIRAYPQIHIHFQYEHSNNIYELVQKGKIDLGVVAYPTEQSKITITPFATDQLILITPKHHPLANAKSIRLAQIQGEPFVAFDKGIPSRTAIDNLLRQKGIDVDIQMTNNNVDTLKKAVEVGLGISIVPSKTVKEELRTGTLKSVKINDLKLTRPIGIISLKEHVPNYPTQLFLEMFTEKKPLSTTPFK